MVRAAMWRRRPCPTTAKYFTGMCTSTQAGNVGEARAALRPTACESSKRRAASSATAEAVSDGSRAMTIHKSQGATEKDGTVVTLDDTVRQPCQACVGLSRVKRLADLFLIAFTESAIIHAVGVEAALLQLRSQQVHITKGVNSQHFFGKNASRQRRRPKRWSLAPLVCSATTTCHVPKRRKLLENRRSTLPALPRVFLLEPGLRLPRSCPLRPKRGQRRSDSKREAQAATPVGQPRKIYHWQLYAAWLQRSRRHWLTTLSLQRGSEARSRPRALRP